ncbi:polysaccharide deacetylase family protein [Helicobacter cynogastricus]|uniref:polysaccharide deacetylase family protein n=1 Tax=Helicobacter cynogastricus TaxID=329937 RepID=UPI000CF0BB24|nr:polysaccharide deacetylase family protein [Helicobacter cynogastricus]
MKEALKARMRSLATLLSNNSLAKRCYQGHGVIFMLHAIPQVSSGVDPSASFLDHFLECLKKAGYSFVCLDEICHLFTHNKPFKNIAHFTLDDGYACTLHNALPVFKAHNAPFTTYICTDCISKEGMLDWASLHTLAQESLCTIGGHTKSHPRLSQIRERERVLEEIAAGNTLLKEHLGTEVEHFAYPYGGYNAAGHREVEIVKELGLKSAVTTRRGTLYPTHKDFLACLPRVMLTQNFKLHEIWRIRKYQVATL